MQKSRVILWLSNGYSVVIIRRWFVNGSTTTRKRLDNGSTAARKRFDSGSVIGGRWVRTVTKCALADVEVLMRL